MSQFVQATLNYVSRSVLHASWADFATSLKQASTIDHIYNAHTEYIKRLLKRLEVEICFNFLSFPVGAEHCLFADAF